MEKEDRIRPILEKKKDELLLKNRKNQFFNEKNAKILNFLCIFLLISIIFVNLTGVYALENEEIEFMYNGKLFDYVLSSNVKTNPQFDLNYELNKYERFDGRDKRTALLSHMLEIGFDEEVALNYIFPNLNTVISKLEKNIFVAPKNARRSINENTSKVFFIEKEMVGVALDRQKLCKNLIQKYLSGDDLKIEIPIKTTMPKLTADELQKSANLRADFSTAISGTDDRRHNIKNALNSLNRVQVAPNEVFSFNKTVGRRTENNGYRNAKIIVGDEFVDGVGGGVCQVSTTLYNAALLSGLQILEANKHSKQISYVKYGFDAMVNFGSSDLKFKNNTGEAVTIITNYSNKTARIRIFGESLGEVEYKLKNEIVSITEPTIEERQDEKGEYLDKVEYEDEFFFLKAGTRGMEVKSYREKYVHDQLVSCELLRDDKFKVQNAVKVFGTKKRELSIIDFLTEQMDEN